MKHIRKFNKLKISEDIEFGWDRFQDRHKKIAEDEWGSDIEDSIREIFQEFYDLIYERFTEIKFSQNYRGDIGKRIIIQFVYNNIFHKIPLDEVSNVMIKTWTELGQSIKKFQSIHHCKLVDIEIFSTKGLLNYYKIKIRTENGLSEKEYNSMFHFVNDEWKMSKKSYINHNTKKVVRRVVLIDSRFKKHRKNVGYFSPVLIGC